MNMDILTLRLLVIAIATLSGCTSAADKVATPKEVVAAYLSHRASMKAESATEERVQKYAEETECRMELMDSQSDPADEVKKSYAEHYPIRLEGRFEYIQGWTETGGYNNPSITTGMLVSGVNLHDNIRISVGPKMGRLSGPPNVPTEVVPEDNVIFKIISPTRALLGSRPWPIEPILEPNFTFQGTHPGIE